MALRVPEMCFWPGNTRKNLNFLRCIHVFDLVLKFCSDKWKKLSTASILLLCIVGYSCLGYWKDFFSSMCQDLGWSFLAMQCYGSVCNWNPKLIWARLRIFRIFCCNMRHFIDFISTFTETCMNCSNVILFWRHQIFSIVSLRGIVVCSLKKLVLFSHILVYYRLISFSIALQLYFLSFWVFLFSSPESWDEISLWLLLKTN